MEILNLIKEQEKKFYNVKKRFYYLKRIEKELHETTQGKLYDIRGDVMYQMIRDSYYMLIIDLASIARGMVTKKGFFPKLRNFIKDLNVPNNKDITAAYFETYQTQDLFAEKLLLESCLKSYDRVFPNVRAEKRTKPNQADVDLLKDRFYNFFEEVIRDRDRNRAHRFEKRETEKEVVPLLNLEQLELKFEAIEQIVNDIRIVTDKSTFLTNDGNFSNSDRMAQTIVDTVLIGSRDQVCNAFGINKDCHQGSGKYTYMYRQEYYSKMHCHHELHVQRINSKSSNDYQNHQDYSKIKIKEVPVNFDIFLNQKFKD